eukprot:721739-Prymnesium_polylepis.1
MGAEVVVIDTAALAPGETSTSALEKDNHNLKAQVRCRAMLAPFASACSTRAVVAMRARACAACEPLPKHQYSHRAHTYPPSRCAQLEDLQKQLATVRKSNAREKQAMVEDGSELRRVDKLCA